ncbi:MAG: hypothetical protein LBJ40_00055 [Delftia acidovorans]|nr:hypothetical protein [Delftia acidovorans]
MAAALDVLELHIRHRSTAINCACRDLLRLYYAEAEQALERKGDVLGMLRGIALNLGHAIEVVDQLNCHGADDTILHAVGFLLKAARRLVDEALVGALP